MKRGANRRPLAALGLVAAGVVGSGVLASAVTAPLVEPAAVSVASSRLEVPRPVLVIGDSAIAGIRWVPGAATAVAGVDRTLDLESCRRLVQPSCRGREGRVPLTALEVLRASKSTYDTVVIATGYNDSTEGFDRWFRTIVAQARAQGVERIVWFTLRSDVTYLPPGTEPPVDDGDPATDDEYQTVFATNNQTLRDLVATGQFPDVTIADWNTYTASLDHWFTADGVHYRTIGAWGAADYLSRKLAFLAGRPCPMPVRPGAARPAPCPDPDVTGPVAQITELYQIGVDGVLCYEIGDTREVSCRASSPVEPVPESVEFDGG